MNSYKKGQINKYLVEYLNKEHDVVVKNNNKFNCPCCGGTETATIYPNNTTKFYCLSPECNFKGNIFDLFKATKNKNMSDNKIADYLSHKLNIKLKESLDDILSMYESNNFCCFPLEPESKNPKYGFKWTEKNYTNKKVWKDWVDLGYGLGLRLGKEASKVIAIDIDDDKTYKKMKDLLGDDTLIQQTSRGKHFLYEYDDDFDDIRHANLRSKGYEMEIRANNAYIAIAPTSANGETREWNNKPIQKMTKELKTFFLGLADKEEKSNDEEIQEAIDKNVLGIKNGLRGLEGECNDTFIKLGGILRKKLDVSNTEYALNVYNNTLAEPMDQKTMRSLFSQINKYRTYDKEELAKEVLSRLETTKEGTAFQISKTIKKEQKDVEDVLKYLEDQSKVFKTDKKNYQIVNNVEWGHPEDSANNPIDFVVPYFGDYNYFDYGEMCIIGAQSGKGKCFGKGTKILMYDGSYKKVEQIVVGDLLMGVDSSPRKVLKLSKGVDSLYKLIPNKGKSCIINSRHILSLKKSGTNNIVNIQLNDYLNSSKTFKNLHKLYKVPIDFNKKEYILEPYFVGAWLGDGDSRDSRICTPDIEVVNYLKDYCDRLNLTFKKYDYNGRCPAYKLSSRRSGKARFNIKDELRKLNLLQNKHIPDIYKYNSREVRLQLLAGLLDTDGHVSDNKFEIVTKYEKLKDDIVYLAGSLGFQVTFSIKNVKLKHWDTGRDYFRIQISGFCENIPNKIERKKAFPRRINKNPLVCGFKIEKIEKGEYFGFELDGDNLHLIEDFWVHHNTHLTGNIIKKLHEQNLTVDLINTEANSKFIKVLKALKTPLTAVNEPKTQFKHPMEIELRDNAITIIDWIKAKDGNFAETDNTFDHFRHQLSKHGGFLFILTQLRNSNAGFFAPDLVSFYGSCVVKYLWGDNGKDPINTYFQFEKLRDSKNGMQYFTVPTYYDKDKKILETR